MLCDKFWKLKKVQQNIKLLRFYCSPSEVIIPKRIHRGPTDILEAISSTVKRDPTAAHYKYHDDPYLIPTSNFTKRIYALAQESGKKAAIWIKQQHPQLFMHQEAEPPIQAFFPRVTYDEEDEVDNEVLSNVIASAFVSDSITVYQLMQKKGIEVSEKNKQSLLELLCFFNETDDTDEDLVEERWFMQASKAGKYALKKTWKDGKFTETLFNEITPSATSYSAIIQGMAKYYQVDRAFELYQKAQQNGFILSVDAFNYLIRGSVFIKEGLPKRWELVTEILTTMNNQGVKPNIRTLNAVLQVLSLTSTYKETKKYALKTIAEMKQFDIEPCLTSFVYLLDIFYPDRKTESNETNLLEEILNYLEEKGGNLIIQERSDVTFFPTAMEKCRYVLRNKDIAYRINHLLNTGRNYNFIGDSYKESVYYRNFFFLLCETEVMEAIMENYDLLVPNVYIPEVSVLEELIKVATMNGANHLFPRFWSDIVSFDLYDNENLIKSILSGMMLNRSLQLSTVPSNNSVAFANVAWAIFQKVEEGTPQTKNQISWTGNMLGDIMTLCLYANDLEKASIIMNKLNNDQHKIIGIPSTEVFITLIEVCITHKDAGCAVECIDYCAQNGLGAVEELAQKLASSVELNVSQKTKIVALVGSHVLKNSSDEIQAVEN